MLQSYRSRHFFFSGVRLRFFSKRQIPRTPGGKRVLGEETSNLDVEGIEPFSGWHQQPFGSLCCKTHGSRMLMSLVHVCFFLEWNNNTGCLLPTKNKHHPKRGRFFVDSWEVGERSTKLKRLTSLQHAAPKCDREFHSKSNLWSETRLIY